MHLFPSECVKLVHVIKLVIIENHLTISVESNKKKLHVHHEDAGSEAIFDLCDMDGRIRFTGKLDEEGKANIDVSALKKGQYQLFVINKGNIHKKLVQINPLV